jgi:hypothetical protein
MKMRNAAGSDTYRAGAATGPANVHFIRDLGWRFLVSAVSLLWFAKSPPRAWPVALAGVSFLALHALAHLCGYGSWT